MPPAVRWLSPIDPDRKPRELLLGTRHPHNPLVHRMLDGSEHAARELATRYEAMADIWAAWTDEHREYYAAPLREAARRIPSGSSVLELSAGTGVGTRALEALRLCPVAVEPVERMAREIGLDDMRVVIASAFELPFREQGFDVVAGLNAVMSVAEVIRVSRPNGTLIWCYSFGEDTPVYVAPTTLAEAFACPATAQRVGPGMWIRLDLEDRSIS